MGERFDQLGEQFDGLGDRVTSRLAGFDERLENRLVGFEGKLDARYAETVRLTIFAVVSLMIGFIAAVTAIVGLG